MGEIVWALDRSNCARRACEAVLEAVIDRRDTDDSCMMDGLAIERMASVVPAIMGGEWRTSRGRGEKFQDYGVKELKIGKGFEYSIPGSRVKG